MRALAMLLAVFPIVSLADDAPVPPPRWSLGAGISTAVIYVTNTGESVGLSGPSAAASLERRLSESNWLVLGVDGTISESRWENSDGSERRTSSRRLDVDFGLRHVLTGRGAVVDVSVLALARGGYAERTQHPAPVPEDGKFTDWIAGGSVGLAIDRELTERLSLRVATPLLDVWWLKSTGDVRSEYLAASVVLAPRLELRLAF